MTKKRKRLLGLLLTLVMVVGLVPFAAVPADSASDETGTAYAASATLKITGDTTLYAQLDAVTVTFDANGGTPTPDAQTIAKGGTATKPATDPAKASATFVHWYVDGEDENTAYDFSTPVTGNITMKAKWVGWANGTITAYVRILDKASARSYVYPRYGWHPGNVNLGLLAGIPVYLLDENGTVLQTKTTDAGKVTFDGLSEGKYYLSILREAPAKERYSILTTISRVSGLLYPIKTETSDVIEITQSNPTGKTDYFSRSDGQRDFVVYFKTFAFTAKTDLGTFTGTWYKLEDDGKTRVYLDGNDFTYINGTIDFTQFMGIMWGDSASQYPSFNTLEVPTLSGEEEAFGYEFVGWRVEGSTDVLTTAKMLSYIVYGDTVFHAVWTYPTHTVIFATDTDKGSFDSGTSKSVSVDGNNSRLTDEMITIPEPKAGYEFIGWYTDPGTTNLVDPTADNVTSNITYYAKYCESSKKFTVTWKNGETVLETDENVALNAAPSCGEAAPGKDADSDYTYSFLGWSKNENATTGLAVEDLPKVTEDVTYYAIFQKTPKASLKVTYIANGGTGEAPVDDKTYSSGDTVTVLGQNELTKTNHTFTGWLDQDNVKHASESKFEISKNMFLIAQWEPAKYKVTYQYTGTVPTVAPAVPEEAPYGVGALVTVAATPSVGTHTFSDGDYIFSGWDKTDFTMPGNNVTITGSWAKKTTDPDKVTVIYDSQGGTPVAPETLDIGNQAPERTTTKDGHALVGWYLNGELYDFTKPVNEDITLTANWTTENIPVHFQFGHNGKQTTGDTTLLEQKVEYGKSSTAPKITANANYVFIGWEIAGGDGTCYSNAAVNTMPITKETTFIAHYQNIVVSGGGGSSGGGGGGGGSGGGGSSSGSSGGGGGGKVTPPDVPSILNGEDHYAYIIGRPGGNVCPEDKITRAEVATIFFRLLTSEVRDGTLTRTNSFSDVTEGMWFNTAISTLERLGIINGCDDGDFHPNAYITRAEFAAMAVRFDKDAEAVEAQFTDIDGHWAKTEIQQAAGNGWVNGYPDSTFRPGQDITRAEAMALINRVLRRDPAEPGDLLDNMIRWPDNMDTSVWYYLDVQEATNSHVYERNTKTTEVWTQITPAGDWSAYEK